MRTLTGATPANTANRQLSSMVHPNNSSYDKGVRKTGRGMFALTSASNSLSESEDEDLDETEEQESADGIQRLKVHAFGMYWDREKVACGMPEILGRQTRSSDRVNFAEQKGVYLLHRGNSVVYVGKGSLYRRLNAHQKETSKKTLRWTKFSWFGFRGVQDNSQLEPLCGKIDADYLIRLLEAVLIEVLEPPVNGQRGEGMGELYEQVAAPDIASQQSRDFLRRLSGG